MKTTNLKLAIVLLLALFGGLVWQSKPAQANQGGPPAGLTGAPGESDCLSSGCHTGNDINSTLGTLTITRLPASYRADQEFNLTVTLAQTNRVRF